MQSHGSLGAKRAVTWCDSASHARGAQAAPFFVEKLQVRTLPCIVAFVGGIAVDRVVGFAELGGKDDFPTAKVGVSRVRGLRV